MCDYEIALSLGCITRTEILKNELPIISRKLIMCYSNLRISLRLYRIRRTSIVSPITT